MWEKSDFPYPYKYVLYAGDLSLTVGVSHYVESTDWTIIVDLFDFLSLIILLLLVFVKEVSASSFHIHY